MSSLYITTTQNVKLFFTTATLGERMFAYAVDLLIKTAYLIVIYYLFVVLSVDSGIIAESDRSYVVMSVILILPVVFYTLISETFMEGRTFGKMLLKIKVVKIDGYQAGFFDYFIRWIFAIVDINLSFLPGVVSIISTKYNQRLGDLAAGTAVISEKSKYNISHTILMDVEEDYKPHFTQNQMILFSDNDIRIIKENADTAIRQSNLKVLVKLTEKIESILQIRNPFKNERIFIEQLQRDYTYHTGK
jgi:uncharacterized RDD family membrane protein YckC